MVEPNRRSLTTLLYAELPLCGSTITHTYSM